MLVLLITEPLACGIKDVVNSGVCPEAVEMPPFGMFWVGEVTTGAGG